MENQLRAELSESHAQLTGTKEQIAALTEEKEALTKQVQYNKYKNYFMKMKGISRDGGTKEYTNNSNIRQWHIATRCTVHLFQCNIVSMIDIIMKKL